jgi:hypothetical protein
MKKKPSKSLSLSRKTISNMVENSPENIMGGATLRTCNLSQCGTLRATLCQCNTLYNATCVDVCGTVE